MSAKEIALTLLPLAVLGLLVGTFVLVLRRRSWMPAAGLAAPDLGAPVHEPREAERPWWGNPWLWAGVSGVFVVLGVFVWRGLFGGVLLLLPFVWIRRPRRGRTVDPRANGHAKHDGTSFR